MALETLCGLPTRGKIRNSHPLNLGSGDQDLTEDFESLALNPEPVMKPPFVSSWQNQSITILKLFDIFLQIFSEEKEITMLTIHFIFRILSNSVNFWLMAKDQRLLKWTSCTAPRPWDSSIRVVFFLPLIRGPLVMILKHGFSITLFFLSLTCMVFFIRGSLYWVWKSEENPGNQSVLIGYDGWRRC